MIVNLLLDILFSFLDWVLGFVPEYQIETLATNTLKIFGYGVYCLGDTFFSLFLTTVISEVVATIAFYCIRFGANLVRGSGG